MIYVITWNYLDGSGHGVLAVCQEQKDAETLKKSFEIISCDRSFAIWPMQIDAGRTYYLRKK